MKFLKNIKTGVVLPWTERLAKRGDMVDYTLPEGDITPVAAEAALETTEASDVAEEMSDSIDNYDDLKRPALTTLASARGVDNPHHKTNVDLRAELRAMDAEAATE